MVDRMGFPDLQGIVGSEFDTNRDLFPYFAFCTRVHPIMGPVEMLSSTWLSALDHRGWCYRNRSLELDDDDGECEEEANDLYKRVGR